MNSTVLPSFQFGMNCQGFVVARLTWPAYVDGRKLENSYVWKDRCIVASTCRRSVPFGCYITWLWMGNCFSVMSKMLPLFNFTISCHGNRTSFTDGRIFVLLQPSRWTAPSMWNGAAPSTWCVTPRGNPIRLTMSNGSRGVNVSSRTPAGSSILFMNEWMNEPLFNIITVICSDIKTRNFVHNKSQW